MSRAGTTARSWYTVSIPAARASRVFLNDTGWPFIRIWPESGITAPARALIKLLLPAPLSPMTASTSPARSSKSAPLIAVTLPYFLTRPRASRTGLFPVVIVTSCG